tara:strand:+ start:412 stop:1272 length:861 start_codon:yes stop_codon:yes gene_type:complete
MIKILIAVIFFIYGLQVGSSHMFPFELIKGSYQVVKNIINGSMDYKNLEECRLEQLNEIPSDSTIIIGHAYGSKSEVDGYLASGVENFLNKNREKIDKVILTGDVFAVPSLEKWNALHQQFISSFQIYVAPGNHDIDTLASNEIFNMSKFGFKESISINDDPHLIIENSVSTNMLMNDFTVNLVNKTKQSSVYLFRHHVPVQELIKASNLDYSSNKLLPNVNQFANQFTKVENFVVVSGDSGRYASRPRITCNKYKNITFVTNGIGDREGDVILVLNNGRLSYFKI